MAQLAIMVVVAAVMYGAEMLLAAATKPKTTSQNILMGSAWGNPRPILYGASRIGGELIWTDAIVTRPNTSGGGGKGGGGGGGGGSPHISCTFAVAFCEGPVTSLGRVWASGQLIFDPELSFVNSPVNTTPVHFYKGDETQNPDPDIAGWAYDHVPAAPGAVPAFRGTCYAVFHNMNLNPFGGALPQISAEIINSNTPKLQVTPFQLTAVAGSAFVGSNPPYAVDYVRGILYVTENGVGYRLLSLATMGEIGQILTDKAGGPMTCGQGGALFNYSGRTVYQYDPDTLKQSATFGPDTSLGDLSNTIGGLSSLVYSNSMTAVTVVGYAGNQNFLVCGTFSGGYGVLQSDDSDLEMVNAVGIGADPLDYGGDDAVCLVVAGAQNGGSAEVWMLNCGSGISASPTISIFLMTITPGGFSNDLGAYNAAVAVTPVGSINASDFVPGSPPAPTGGYAIAGYCYDVTDDTLIISALGTIIKWSATNGVVWRQTAAQANFHPQSRPYGTLGFWAGGDEYTYMDATDGNIISTAALTSGPAPLFQNTGTPNIWDGTSQSVIYASGNPTFPVRAYLNMVSSAPVDLAYILTDICLRGGLTSDQIDVSLITQNVAGFLLDQMITCRDAIAQLQAAYFFDVVESDFKLKFVPRGGASVATISQVSLGSVATPDDGNYWQHTRAQEQDLPLFVQVTFTDTNNAYLPNAAYSQRTQSPVPITLSKQRASATLPISMEMPDALVITQTSLWTAWAERDSYQTTLGWQFAYLDPSDVVTVNLDNGDSYTARISSMQMGADYSMKIELQGTDTQTYSQQTDVVVQPPAFEQVVFQTGSPRFIPMNLPLLRDQDYTAGAGAVFYYAAGSYNGVYTGGTLNQSSNGTTYAVLGGIPTQANWGNCLTVLPPPATYWATDTESTLTVMPVHESPELASVTELEMFEGANAAVVGSEVIQFMNAEPNSDGSYTLSGLLRGRKGTEWACATHTASEKFVVLDTNVQLDVLPLSDNNSTDIYKLQANNVALDATLAVSFTFLGYDQKPHSPVGFSRAASGSDLAVAWLRRTRATADLLVTIASGTTPLFEETEAYDAYVLAAPYDEVAANYSTPGTFVRSFLALSSPTFTYTEAMMATDGFVLATSTLHVVVFQNSVTIGHGWPGSDDLQPPA